MSTPCWTAGSLVDGRWYHTEEFARVIEQYHSKAVEAHRLHGHVEVPLPEPSQPVGVIALPVAAAMAASGTTNGAGHAQTSAGGSFRRQRFQRGPFANPVGTGLP